MDDAMTPQEFERRFTAILRADIAGYSRIVSIGTVIINLEKSV